MVGGKKAEEIGFDMIAIRYRMALRPTEKEENHHHKMAACLTPQVSIIFMVKLSYWDMMAINPSMNFVLSSVLIWMMLESQLSNKYRLFVLVTACWNA